MILLDLTTEMVRLLGLFPTLVLSSAIGLFAAQCMFVWLGMIGPPQE